MTVTLSYPQSDYLHNAEVATDFDLESAIWSTLCTSKPLNRPSIASRGPSGLVKSEKAFQTVPLREVFRLSRVVPSVRYRSRWHEGRSSGAFLIL